MKLFSAFRRSGPQVYLASREDMFHVQRLVAGLPIRQASDYLGIIGGLGTLNFIEALEPRRIVLADKNRAQVEYARCVLDLVRLSASRREFVERFFSRRYMAEEEAFLGQRGDQDLFHRTAAETRHPEAFRQYFTMVRDAEPSAAGLLVRGNALCRRLRLSGPPRGTPTGDNFLYFGQGWLKDEASYARLRSILGRAEPDLIHSSIADIEPDLSGECLCFHGSNALESSPRACRRFLGRAAARLARLDKDIAFIHLSTYHAMDFYAFRRFRPLGPDVHRDCALKVAAYTRGRDVLEVVPGKHCFGRELEARSLEVKTLDEFRTATARRKFEVAVSHILYASLWPRLSRPGFERILARLLALADTLVVVEHNSQSLDFRGRPFLKLEDLAGILVKLRGLEMSVEFSKGQKDDRRNIILGLRVSP